MQPSRQHFSVVERIDGMTATALWRLTGLSHGIHCQHRINWKNEVISMEKLMIEDGYIKDSYMPKALCGVGRDGYVDDCDACSEYCEDRDGECLGCAIHECFKRLAEYEKTGLTPQQIVEMDKLYREKCGESARFERI